MFGRITTAAMLAGMLGCSYALAGSDPSLPAAAAAIEPPASRSTEAGAADTMDPVMRAILLAMVAKVLREAAASPDPLATLGETIDRSVTSAMASPQTFKTIEALTAQALKEAPPELRQALLAFIASALKHARREGSQARSEAR